MAEKKGFEPLLGLRLLLVFETSPFNHLGTSPTSEYYTLTESLFNLILSINKVVKTVQARDLKITQVI